MTGWFLLLIVLSQVFMVGGQIFLQHAMNGGAGGESVAARWKRAAPFACVKVSE